MAEYKPNTADVDYLTSELDNLPDSERDSVSISSGSESSELGLSSGEEETKKNSPKGRMVTHTTKNDTVDKLYELFISNNDLKMKLAKMTNDRDKTEEHLRKTVLAYQTKNEMYDKLEKENNKLVLENINQKKRIVKIREKCLKRKDQFHITLCFLGFSVLYNMFPNIINTIFNKSIIPYVMLVLHNKWFLIILRNLIVIIFATIIYHHLIYKKIQTKVTKEKKDD